MTLHRSNKPALWLLAAALTILAVTILATSAMTAPAPAHAQAGSGAIPSITLESNEPGKLVITWATPDPTPTDYRLTVILGPLQPRVSFLQESQRSTKGQPLSRRRRYHTDA